MKAGVESLSTYTGFSGVEGPDQGLSKLDCCGDAPQEYRLDHQMREGATAVPIVKSSENRGFRACASHFLPLRSIITRATEMSIA